MDLPEPDLLQRLGKLTCALVSDALDAEGLRHQAMNPGLWPLGQPELLVGRAATLQVQSVDTAPARLYQVQLDAVDSLEAGQVMVVAAAPVPSAFWGELLTVAARARGCPGAVVDGYTRDLAGIGRTRFGLWARGGHPADSAGRLDAVSHGHPVRCAGVLVHPGDYVLADLDGVVVIPQARADQIVVRAEQKASAEQHVRRQLAVGHTATDTYEQHQVM